jgi:hypothetical protein
MKLEWKLLIAIIERITKWLDNHFSLIARRRKKLTEEKDKAIEDKDSAKLQIVLEKLRELDRK